MDQQPQPLPAAAQAAPAFVHEGKQMDIVLKMRLWDLLSSNMIVLGEVSDPSFDDEARWREKRWLHAYEGDLLDAAKVLDLTEDGNIVAIRVAELIERMKGPRKPERRETARAAQVASRVSYVTDTTRPSAGQKEPLARASPVCDATVRETRERPACETSLFDHSMCQQSVISMSAPHPYSRLPRAHQRH
jgi:hypothetical protein